MSRAAGDSAPAGMTPVVKPPPGVIPQLQYVCDARHDGWGLGIVVSVMCGVSYCLGVTAVVFSRFSVSVWLVAVIELEGECC